MGAVATLVAVIVFVCAFNKMKEEKKERRKIRTRMQREQEIKRKRKDDLIKLLYRDLIICRNGKYWWEKYESICCY